ncbi:MAG: hypothetical protein Ct9H300mP21_00210 [Pseudomonadota bacterium]|nr:MAG: hypothetical protein Ct9H300mP21_00210 [Pseudomonadota bacterium]
MQVPLSQEERGMAAEKMSALQEAGIHVVKTPAEIGEKMLEALA